MIEIVVTFCLGAFSPPSANCHVLHIPTQKMSIEQCQVAGRKTAAVMVQFMPGWRVAKFKCADKGEDT